MRMNSSATALIVSFLLAATSAVASDPALPKPTWNRHAAMQSASLAETRASLESLFELAREGRSAELMHAVLAIEEDTGWTEPGREKVLYSLALGLGEFEPGIIEPEVLRYLAERRSRTLVPHEEHPEMGVPLFNVRAAATGSLAEWERYGKRVQAENISRKTYVPYPDVDDFIQAISAGGETSTAEQIRFARGIYDPAELEFIVTAAPDLEDMSTASLVLAELSPGILDRPATLDLLFSLLEHRELGATAALVLAGSGNEAIFERLAALASSGEGLAARRAILAIESFQPTVNPR